MRKLFGYTKYFFDIFSEKKDYLVLFISIIRIGKIYNSYIQIHLRESDHSDSYKPILSFRGKLKFVEYQTNKIIFREGTIDPGKDSVMIRLKGPSINVDLEYKSVHPQTKSYNPLEIRSSGKPVLSWIPVQIKGSVTGKISLSGKQMNYSNAGGYIDEVRTSALPLSLKMKKLFWGRLHNDKIDLTYSCLIDGNGGSDSMLIILFRNEIIQISDLKLLTSGEIFNNDLKIVYPDKLMLTANNTKFSVTIGISDNMELILNDFMDPGDQYNRVFSGIVRWISGDPGGIKFLSRADIFLDDGQDKSEFRNVPMISEFVSFGRYFHEKE